MRSISLKHLLIAASFTGLVACQPESEDRNVFQQIDQEVSEHSNAYRSLELASEQIGHRLTGTKNGAKAEEYTFDLFKSYGLDARYQTFEVEAWSRDQVSLQIGTKGQMEELPVVSLAHSPVKANLKGQLVDVGNGLAADYEGKNVKGKIALAYIGILPDSPEGTHNLHRSEKTALAIQNGAKGIVIINQVDGGVLLTGAASVDGTLLDIPAVCIGKEDGMALKEQLESQELLADIQMTNKSEVIKARNVIATLKGSEKPEEKIIIGGHLDSWDLATGAIDNGIGSFAIIDIARTFKALKLQPKRTIEFVMFMGEEQGLLGSKAMIEQYTANQTLDQVKYMINIDMTGNPKGFNAGGFDEAQAFFKKVGQKIHAYDSSFEGAVSSRAGLHSDHQSFMLEGIPVAGLIGQLDRKVYKCYHSDCDGFDLVNEEHMKNTVRYTSMMLYELANAAELPADRLESEEVKAMMVRHNLKEKLQLGGEWKWN